MGKLTNQHLAWEILQEMLQEILQEILWEILWEMLWEILWENAVENLAGVCIPSWFKFFFLISCIFWGKMSKIVG